MFCVGSLRACATVQGSTLGHICTHSSSVGPGQAAIRCPSQVLRCHASGARERVLMTDDHALGPCLGGALASRMPLATSAIRASSFLSTLVVLERWRASACGRRRRSFSAMGSRWRKHTPRTNSGSKKMAYLLPWFQLSMHPTSQNMTTGIR